MEASMSEALRRVTDLFVEGTEVVLREAAEGVEPVLIWVNKLNDFESEEARKDGSVARSRVILALKELESDEKTLYEASLGDEKPESIRDSILANNGDNFFLRAINTLRVDEDWAERYETLQRSPEQVADLAADDPERVVLAKINDDYIIEVTKRLAGYRDEMERDLLGLDDTSLREKHREMWLSARGTTSFLREFNRTQLFYAYRVCKATAKQAEADAWDHGGCDHSQRALASRDERLPSELIGIILNTLRAVTVEQDDARFSDGAASSSASSPQPNEEAESTPSTPEAASSELVETSS